MDLENTLVFSPLRKRSSTMHLRAALRAKSLQHHLPRRYRNEINQVLPRSPGRPTPAAIELSLRALPLSLLLTATKELPKITPVDQHWPGVIYCSQSRLSPPPHGVRVNGKKVGNLVHRVSPIDLDQTDIMRPPAACWGHPQKPGVGSVVEATSSAHLQSYELRVCCSLK